jgi:hypothetical protein
LIDALLAALKVADPATVKTQISAIVPPDVQQILAAAGIRDEQVFPTPAVLEAAPRLLGYYRLLLNVPQKTFYRSASGFGGLRTMEGKGTLRAAQQAQLPALCSALAAALAELVRGMAPTLSTRDIFELPLLTLGSQLQGGANNIIGQQAVEAVFQAITKIVQAHISASAASQVIISNSAGQQFLIARSNDPDVDIREIVTAGRQPRIAIEVKGGTDQSNAYNRAGEAEKSHIKANIRGYSQRWTVIGTRGVANAPRLKAGSPTTTQWFEATEVMAQAGHDWSRFEQLLRIELGIP